MLNLKNDLIVGMILFVSTFSRSHSLFTALLVSCTVTIFFAVSTSIWRSKSTIVIKFVQILAFAGLMSGIFYISIIAQADYYAKKQIQLTFSIEEINDLNQEYKFWKEFDIKKTTIDISNRLKDEIQDGNIEIKRLLDELRYINAILENPFIANKCEIKDLLAIRKIIIETLEDFGKNAPPTFIESIRKAEKIYQLEYRIYCNPIKVESYIILLENGPRQYFKFFEELFKTKEGRIKFKKLAALRSVELQLLEFFIDDKATFEQEAMRLLCLGQYDRSIQEIFGFDRQQYLNEHFIKFIDTIDGRKKIIQDIQKLNKAVITYADALCNLVEDRNEDLSLDESKLISLLKERIGSQIKNIILTIGKVYE